MSYIDPTPPPATPAKQALDQAFGLIGRALTARIHIHKQVWLTIWQNPQATPEEIFAAAGPKGVLLLQSGADSRADFERIATSNNVSAAELLGDEKYLSSGRPVTIDPQTGIVTVAPLPAPEPEPTPELEEQP